MKTDAILFASPDEISTCEVDVPEPGKVTGVTLALVKRVESPVSEVAICFRRKSRHTPPVVPYAELEAFFTSLLAAAQARGIPFSTPVAIPWPK